MHNISRGEPVLLLFPIVGVEPGTLSILKLYANHYTTGHSRQYNCGLIKLHFSGPMLHVVGYGQR
jgi:hypothetical protein